MTLLPSDSLVDFDDVLNIGVGSANIPSNRNPSNAALQCITDLEDCCGTEQDSNTSRTEHGDWFFPDGRRIDVFDVRVYGGQFLVNRGPNEIIDGEQVYGSVRLFCRYSLIPGRGRFRCKLPSTANPNINQILYANICEFIEHNYVYLHACISV